MIKTTLKIASLCVLTTLFSCNTGENINANSNAQDNESATNKNENVETKAPVATSAPQYKMKTFEDDQIKFEYPEHCNVEANKYHKELYEYKINFPKEETRDRFYILRFKDPGVNNDKNKEQLEKTFAPDNIVKTELFTLKTGQQAFYMHYVQSKRNTIAFVAPMQVPNTSYNLEGNFSVSDEITQKYIDNGTLLSMLQSIELKK